ncbi:hypothetical protein AGMMS49942_19440 [Spirochaetia bacterium]|nr:hypothetical protein AGMMS49942_19440 [Spirochaetia bacterium]
MGTDVEPKGSLAEILPFESWERLSGESAAAFAAFCAFRDFGAERNIRRVVESWQQAALVKDETKRGRQYRLWRGWSAAFKWRERAADFDGYVDKLKQAEVRRTIEEQGTVDRAVLAKMLGVVGKKLDCMDPADLGQATLPVWVTTAIRLNRELLGLVDGKEKPDGAVDASGQINFISEFEGL